MTKDLNRNFKVWETIYSFDPALIAKEDKDNNLTDSWVITSIDYKEVTSRRWHYYRDYITETWSIKWEHVIFNNKEDRDEEIRQGLIVSLEFYKNQKENAITEYDKMMKEIDWNLLSIEKQAKLNDIDLK